MVAPSVSADVEALAKAQAFPITLVKDEAEKADAYAAMTVAIACSGTVTTELAAQGAAVVTGYKLGWITWALLRFLLFKSRFSALVNVAANREVIPEFLQTRFSVKNIEQAVEARGVDEAARVAVVFLREPTPRVGHGYLGVREVHGRDDVVDHPPGQQIVVVVTVLALHQEGFLLEVIPQEFIGRQRSTQVREHGLVGHEGMFVPSRAYLRSEYFL